MATSPLPNGIKISFSKTPQATSDDLKINEDGDLIRYLDVLANDLGGSAKTLYSLDDGIDSSTQTQLLEKDTVARDTSAQGVPIWIASDGTVAYDTTAIASMLQAMGEGETFKDSFSYAIRLSNGTLSWTTAEVTIIGANDAPTVITALAASADEGAAAFSLDLLTGASDVDNGETASLTVTEVRYSVDGGAASETMPAGVSLAGHTLSVNPAHAVFDSLAQGETSTIVVSYLVTDAHGATVAQTETITITGTNDAPVINTAAANVALEEANSVLSSSGAVGFVDADHNAIVEAALTTATVTPAGIVLTQAQEAAFATAFTIAKDGQWNFNLASPDYLAADQSVTVAYQVTVTDDKGGTATQVQTITITGTNDAPVITAALAAKATEGDPAFTSNLLAGASDVDNGETASLTVTEVRYSVDGGAASETMPAGVSLAGHTLSVNPAHAVFDSLAQGETSTIVVSYLVTDAHGATVAQTETITITGTNDAPVVSGAVTGTASEDGAVSTLDALAKASDVDHDAVLQVVNVPTTANLPAGVTYDVATHSFTLNPADAAYQSLAAGKTTKVTVNYGVSDGTDTTSASVTWTITGTNDAPVAVAKTDAAAEGGAIVAGQVVATDVDDGAHLAYSLTADAPAGLTFNADGSYSFDPTVGAYDHLAAGAKQDVVVSFKANDGTADSQAKTLTITVTGTNDAPVAVADVNSGKEDATITGTVAANDSDVDTGAALSYSLTAPVAGLALAADGSYSFNAGNAAYQNLAQGETANVVANYTVTDEHGAKSASTLTITLTGTNDAPVAVAKTDAATEGGAIVTGQVVATDADEGAQLSYSLTADAPAGLTFNADGSYSFDPTVGAYNHLAAGATQDVVVTFKANDGTAQSEAKTLTITVTGTNDAPTAQADTASVKEDTLPNPISGNVLVNDNDVDVTDTHTVIAINGSAALVGSDVAGQYGTLHLNADGSYLYTLDNTKASVQALTDGQTVQDLFNYTNGDNHGDSSSATLTISVSGINEVASGVAATDLKFNALNVNGNGLGSTLGKFTFVDPDAGDAAHTYSLTAASIFRLDQNSGTLSTTASLAEKTDYKLEVTVSQAGATSYSETFHIITGSNGEDPKLTGTTAENGSDVIYAQGKDDIIFALGGDDIVFGQQDKDEIHGGDGNDILYGGGGSDTFVFDTALNQLTNVDQIQDFNDDYIALSSSVFVGIGSGAGGILDKSDFATLASSGDTGAVGAGVNIIYDQATGNLFYDADGGDAAGRTQFAHLTIEGNGTFDISNIKVVS